MRPCPLRRRTSRLGPVRASRDQLAGDPNEIGRLLWLTGGVECKHMHRPEAASVQTRTRYVVVTASHTTPWATRTALETRNPQLEGLEAEEFTGARAPGASLEIAVRADASGWVWPSAAGSSHGQVPPRLVSTQNAFAVPAFRHVNPDGPSVVRGPLAGRAAPGPESGRCASTRPRRSTLRSLRRSARAPVRAPL